MFQIDFAWLIGTLAIFAGVMYFQKKRKKRDPSLYFSDNQLFSSLANKGRKIEVRIQRLLIVSLFLLAALALADPHFEKIEPYFQDKWKSGHAIFLLLDKSSSMTNSSFLANQTKWDVMLNTAKAFVLGDKEANLEGRGNDSIGLIAFARKPDIISPLTSDLQAIVSAIDNLKVADKKNDGTALGYAVYKAATMFTALKENTKEMKDATIVVMTDGFPSPHPEDKGNRLRSLTLDEATDYLKKENIKLYLINLEPLYAKKEFLPHRTSLEKSIRKTGGEFFLVENKKDLEKVIRKIDEQEKTSIPELQKPLLVKKRSTSIFSFLICMQMILLVYILYLENVRLRCFP